MINARTISSIRNSGTAGSGKPRKPRVVDQVSMEVQLRIIDMYNSGVSMRRIGEQLYAEGVPHPETKVPWSTEAIAAIIKEHKGK